MLGPACHKVASYASTRSAWCFNNLQKERINAKSPDLTQRNSFTPGKKMDVSPQRSGKATVLSRPSCDYKHSASSYLWLFSLCSRKIKAVYFSPLLSKTLGSLLILFPIHLWVYFLFQLLEHYKAPQCLKVECEGPELPAHYTPCLRMQLVILFFFNMKNIYLIASLLLFIWYLKPPIISVVQHVSIIVLLFICFSAKFSCSHAKRFPLADYIFE